MRTESQSVRKVTEQRLRDLHRQFAEVLQAEGEETLTLTMPTDHPLNKIEERMSALETRLTTIEDKLDKALLYIDSIGRMQRTVYDVVMAAQTQTAQQKIIVPGRG
jgi:hypothetical protein